MTHAYNIERTKVDFPEPLTPKVTTVRYIQRKFYRNILQIMLISIFYIQIIRPLSACSWHGIASSPSK